MTNGEQPSFETLKAADSGRRLVSQTGRHEVAAKILRADQGNEYLVLRAWVGSHPGPKSSGGWSEPSWWQHIVLDDGLNIVATGWGKRERDSFAMAQKVLAAKEIRPRPNAPRSTDPGPEKRAETTVESGSPTSEDASAILRFLPAFEAQGFVPGVEHGGVDDGSGVIEWPWVDYSPEVLDFVRALYDHGWVMQFDWMSWQGEAEQILNRDGGVEKADIDTLRRLLTVIARKDHFSEGFLAVAFSRGWIHRILYRLDALTALANDAR